MVPKITSKLTVFFQEPFWVGICERISGKELEVCKVTFGAEPNDHEIYQFFLENWTRLRFSVSVDVREGLDKKISPKRMQRIIKKQLASPGIGTKAQQALQLQREVNKSLRAKKESKRKADEKQHQFELKQQKRKEKHRGR